MTAKGGHYEPIAREAVPYALPFFIVSLVCWLLGLGWWSLVFLAISVTIALFFRNPDRTPPDRSGVVVSPADGTVYQVIEDDASERLETDGLKRVSIFMSVFNVHVNRAPVSAVVKTITFIPGGYLDARDEESSQTNVRNSLILESADAVIETVQVAGKVARRISCWVREGDYVEQGQRIGLIHFGSRLDVYLPSRYRITVTPGETVSAGVSIIAEHDDAGND